MKIFGSGGGDLHVSPESVLNRLGGPAAVEATVDLFYDKVVRDFFLMPFFESTNLATLKVHQKHFMLLAFTNLLPSEDDHRQVCAYLLKQHQRLFQMGLNETHFDRVAGHLVVSLHELQVKSTLIDEVVAILLPLRPAFQEGARKFGSGESKEESWADHMEVENEEHDAYEPKQPVVDSSNRVVKILAEFNRRVRNDPKLDSLWTTVDDFGIIGQQQGAFQTLLMDISKAKETAQQLLKQSGSLDSDDSRIELVKNHLVATLQNLQEADRASCVHDSMP